MINMRATSIEMLKYCNEDNNLRSGIHRITDNIRPLISQIKAINTFAEICQFNVNRNNASDNVNCNDVNDVSGNIKCKSKKRFVFDYNPLLISSDRDYEYYEGYYILSIHIGDMITLQDGDETLSLITKRYNELRPRSFAFKPNPKSVWFKQEYSEDKKSKDGMDNKDKDGKDNKFKCYPILYFLTPNATHNPNLFEIRFYDHINHKILNVPYQNLNFASVINRKIYLDGYIHTYIDFAFPKIVLLTTTKNCSGVGTECFKLVSLDILDESKDLILMDNFDYFNNRFYMTHIDIKNRSYLVYLPHNESLIVFDFDGNVKNYVEFLNFSRNIKSLFIAVQSSSDKMNDHKALNIHDILNKTAIGKVGISFEARTNGKVGIDNKNNILLYRFGQQNPYEFVLCGDVFSYVSYILTDRHVDVSGDRHVDNSDDGYIHSSDRYVDVSGDGYVHSGDRYVDVSGDRYENMIQDDDKLLKNVNDDTYNIKTNNHTSPVSTKVHAELSISTMNKDSKDDKENINGKDDKENINGKNNDDSRAKIFDEDTKLNGIIIDRELSIFPIRKSSGDMWITSTINSNEYHMGKFIVAGWDMKTGKLKWKKTGKTWGFNDYAHLDNDQIHVDESKQSNQDTFLVYIHYLGYSHMCITSTETGEIICKIDSLYGESTIHSYSYGCLFKFDCNCIESRLVTFDAREIIKEAIKNINIATSTREGGERKLKGIINEETSLLDIITLDDDRLKSIEYFTFKCEKEGIMLLKDSSYRLLSWYIVKLY